MKKGQSLIELLLFIGILVVFLPGLMTALVASREGRPAMQQRLQAATILKETQEQVRSVKEQGWEAMIATITPGAPYHPASTNGTSWSLVSGAETLTNSFSRQVVFNNIIRNNSGDIVPTPTPGMVDPSTTQVTTTVSWTKPYDSKLESTMYLTRFRDNLSHKETTTDQFNLGTKFNADVDSSIEDGAVTLHKGTGGGDWCGPSLSLNKFTIPSNSVGINISSIPNVISGQPNTAYITTGENSSSQPVYSLSITDEQNPNISNGQTYTKNNVRGYGVYSTSQNVYIATDHPGTAVDIINASDFSEVGFFDADNNKGGSVAISGSIGYVTTKPALNGYLYAFKAFPLVDKTKSQESLWNIPLNNKAVGNKIVVSGNYAYIATNATSNSQQLQVVDLITHQIFSPPSSGSNSINTDKAGINIDVLGDYAYLVTNYKSSSIPDIFVIDISTPSSPKVVGTANTFDSVTNTSMDPLGVSITPNQVIVVVGNGGLQYQVFRVNNPASPSRCATLQNPNGASQINAVSTLTEADGDVYSYILTTNGSSQQFQIIAGGGGGVGGYVSYGTFESNPFSPGYSTAFNRFVANINQDTTTTEIQMQVAVVNKINNSCTDPGINYASAYVGPLGNPSLSFTSTDNSTINGTIPFGAYPGGYLNPGQCFRYKLTLTSTDNTKTPSFNDITVNYSP